jgi:hypothetical protein
MHLKFSLTAVLATILIGLAAAPASAEEAGAPQPAPQIELAQADGPMVITPQPDPNRHHAVNPDAQPPLTPTDQSTYVPPADQGGPGRPSEAAPGTQGPYVPPEAQSKGTFSLEEINETGHRFFGRVSMGFAQAVEYAFQRAGRPNGYILGEEAGGAFIAGLRYGEGTLYTKDAGDHKVFWQGPSLGYDFGAEGSKTMVLVYDLRSPGEIFNTYAGVDGSAYLIGGVGITFLARDHVVLAPIRSGIGLRLGANIGYLKYTRQPSWNPF